jgi:hypothetical protein
MEGKCCNNMAYYIEEKNELLYYDSSIRYHALILHNDSYGSHQQIWYCPWCGTKLAKDLNEEWGEILENEYGITDPMLDDKNKVPPEFWTDEWWKKRGL